MPPPWRWNEIDCQCCERDCPLTCFRLVGCGKNFAGTAVEIYQSGFPGTTLATAIIEGSGLACVNLSAISGLSLRWRANPRPDDFVGVDLAISPGDPCGKTFGAELIPAPPSGGGGGGGTAGRLTVNMTRCGTPPANGTLIFAYLASNLASSIASATFTSGTAVFTGLPTNVSLVIGGGTFETFPAFSLTCEGIANATSSDSGTCSQTWSFTPVSCSPPITSKCCCSTCFPDTIPCNLTVNDPTSLVLYNEARACNNPPQALASCSAFANRTLPMARGCPTSGESQCWTANDYGTTGCLGFGLNYTMTCEADGIYLTKNQGQFSYASTNTFTPGVYACTSRQPPFNTSNRTLCGSYQPPWTGVIFWPSGAVPYIPAGSGGLAYPKVKAASVTCDPFIATFLMPEFIVPLWTATPIPFNFLFCTYSQCGTCTIPAHVVTVYQ